MIDWNLLNYGVALFWLFALSVLIYLYLNREKKVKKQ